MAAAVQKPHRQQQKQADSDSGQETDAGLAENCSNDGADKDRQSEQEAAGAGEAVLGVSHAGLLAVAAPLFQLVLVYAPFSMAVAHFETPARLKVFVTTIKKRGKRCRTISICPIGRPSLRPRN